MKKPEDSQFIEGEQRGCAGNNGSKRGFGVSPQEAEPETECGGAGRSEHPET